MMSPIRRENWGPEDRRSAHRFPIKVEVRYVLLKGKNADVAGSGRTINISSSGVLFESPHSIRPGVQIELSVAWPARIDGTVGLQLRASGKTVRQQDNCTGVRILHSEFRTCGLQRTSVAAAAKRPYA